MLHAQGISCQHAFALVRPRYPWILHRERRDVGLNGRVPPFQLSAFHCRYAPTGPVTLKICLSSHANFTFL
jgi:hypothetical protein